MELTREELVEIFQGVTIPEISAGEVMSGDLEFALAAIAEISREGDDYRIYAERGCIGTTVTLSLADFARLEKKMGGVVMRQPIILVITNDLRTISLIPITR